MLLVEREQLEMQGDLGFGELAASCSFGMLRPLGSRGAWTPFVSHAAGPGAASCLHTLVLQANNDILAFLSGMPVTRNTKYLDLKNSVSQKHPLHRPTLPASGTFPSAGMT